MRKEYINLQTQEVLDMEVVENLKSNAMLKTNPEMFEIWDFGKNEELNIFKMTRGSGRNVWFYCEKCGESNQQLIKNKTNGVGCPTCRGYYPSKTNNLATTHPQIASEWHPTKNEDLLPSEVSHGSERIVWWLGKDCGHTWDMNIDSRTRENGRNCPYCAGKRISKYINSLSYTDPLISELLLNKSDGDIFSRGSDRKLDFICECGNPLNKRIHTVVTRGLRCPKCNDGLSFGEKVMYNILRESGIDFLYDSTTSFSQGKRYDFILEKYSTIIEVDGEQHTKQRKDSFNSKGRTLYEEQENDRIKRVLALENGFLNYFSIDVENQDFDEFYHSILKSKLLEHLNITDVDTEKINRMSRKSIVLEGVTIIIVMNAVLLIL